MKSNRAFMLFAFVLVIQNNIPQCQNINSKNRVAVVAFGMDNGNAGPWDYHYNTAREFVEVMLKSKQDISQAIFIGENKTLDDLFIKVSELNSETGKLILLISGHGGPGGIEKYSYSEIASRIKAGYSGEVFIFSSFCYSFGLVKEIDGISSTNSYKSVSSWGDTSFPIALFNVFKQPRKFDTNKNKPLDAQEVFVGVESQMREWNTKYPTRNLGTPALNNSTSVELFRY